MSDLKHSYVVALAVDQPDRLNLASHLERLGVEVMDESDGPGATPLDSLEDFVRGVQGSSHGLDAVVLGSTFSGVDPDEPLLRPGAWKRMLPGATFFLVGDGTHINGYSGYVNHHARVLTPDGTAEAGQAIAQRILDTLDGKDAERSRQAQVPTPKTAAPKRIIPPPPGPGGAPRPLQPMPKAMARNSDQLSEDELPDLEGLPQFSKFRTTEGLLRHPLRPNHDGGQTSSRRRTNNPPGFFARFDNSDPNVDEIRRLLLAAGYVQHFDGGLAEHNIAYLTDPFFYRQAKHLSKSLREVRAGNPDFALVMVSGWSRERFEEVTNAGFRPHGVLTPEDGAEHIYQAVDAILKARQPSYMSPTARLQIADESIADSFVLEIRSVS